MSNDNLLVFSGNANRPLAQAVCRELGVPMGKALVWAEGGELLYAYQQDGRDMRGMISAVVFP